MKKKNILYVFCNHSPPILMLILEKFIRSYYASTVRGRWDTGKEKHGYNWVVSSALDLQYDLDFSLFLK